MNIYAGLEILRKRKTPVFNVAEIARALNVKRGHAKTYAKRMTDKKLLFRLAKGLYSTTEDPVYYGSYIIPNSYISFNSALYLHGIINQIPAVVQIVVPKRTRRHVDGIEFITLPVDMVFGFEKKPYAGHEISIADVEKAIIDIIYKQGAVPGNILKKADRAKLISYAKKTQVKLNRG